ncbi:hypothetical protein Psi02_13850 [Planotetraspora silvatica]|uniref:Uncharacterized protein n=1 Tax=Planotetraspora silvatica TaxID=234614 RepID=A0A8J3XM89_9ACTN|nr:hypothetical protein Psi02_13850 [Planotetraspora silvatica]
MGYESPAPSAEQSVLPGLGTGPDLEMTGVFRVEAMPFGAGSPLRAELRACCTERRISPWDPLKSIS